MKTKFINAAAVLLLTCSTGAHADSPSEGNWYVDFGAGYSKSSIGTSDYMDIANDGSLSNPDVDSDVLGFLGTVGYRVSERASIELGYVGVGGSEFKATSDGTGIYPAGRVDVDVDIDGFTAAFAYQRPWIKGFVAHARVGVYSWDSDIDASTATGSAGDGDHGLDRFIGVGISRSIGKLSLRFGYDRYFIDTHYTVISLSARKEF